MPSRNFEERIRDMVEQIIQLQDFVEGMSFDDFSNDKRTLQAVLYGFAILGEAAASLLLDIQSVCLSSSAVVPNSRDEKCSNS